MVKEADTDVFVPFKSGATALEFIAKGVACNNNVATDELVIDNSQGTYSLIALLRIVMTGTYGGVTDNYVKLYGDDKLIMTWNTTNAGSVKVPIEVKNYKSIKFIISARHTSSAQTTIEGVITG